MRIGGYSGYWGIVDGTGIVGIVGGIIFCARYVANIRTAAEAAKNLAKSEQQKHKIWGYNGSRVEGDLLKWNFHNSEMPALNVYKVSAPHFWHLLETVHVQTRSQVLLRTVHIGTASESLSFNPCSNVVKFCLLQKHISEKSSNVDFGETQLMLLPLHCVPLQ